MKRPIIKTAEEARSYAIQWQSDFGKKSMSWEELYTWSEFFQQLANRWDLEEEFLENGII